MPIPQIAVMGDQSSGKSSVLEAICGIPFPRGTGLVTRCATQIRLKKAPPGTEWSAVISLSWNKGQPKDLTAPVSSPSQIESRITALTHLLIKDSGSDFSTESIIIDIISPDVPDLTVVDLPGIIRTTTENQNEKVIDDVNTLIDTFLNQSRTVILAVSYFLLT
jgi:interferon-induced GTP-binding protein Mx1